MNQMFHPPTSIPIDPSSMYYLNPASTNTFPNAGLTSNFISHTTITPSGYSSTHVISPHQRGPEEIATHPRAEQFQQQQSSKENISSARLEGPFEPQQQRIDQNLHQFLQSKPEIDLNVTQRSTTDQHTESSASGTFYHSNLASHENQPTATFLNQPQLGRGLMDNFTEALSVNFSAPTECSSRVQQPLRPEENFQLGAFQNTAGVQTMGNSGNFLDPLSHGSMCHQPKVVCDRADLTNQFIILELESTPNNYNIRRDVSATVINGQTKDSEGYNDERDVGLEYHRIVSDNQQESTFNQFGGYAHPQNAKSGDGNQTIHNNFQSYTL